MKIEAVIHSAMHDHQVTVQTDGSIKTLTIAPKPDGFGSSVNGGELLLLSIATCFCNDIYREARKRNIVVSSVKLSATGEFGAEGEPGRNFRYEAEVKADASDAVIRELVTYVNSIAEIHNTLRKGIDVELTSAAS